MPAAKKPAKNPATTPKTPRAKPAKKAKTSPQAKLAKVHNDREMFDRVVGVIRANPELIKTTLEVLRDVVAHGSDESNLNDSEGIEETITDLESMKSDYFDIWTVLEESGETFEFGEIAKKVEAAFEHVESSASIAKSAEAYVQAVYRWGVSGATGEFGTLIQTVRNYGEHDLPLTFKVET